MEVSGATNQLWYTYQGAILVHLFEPRPYLDVEQKLVSTLRLALTIVQYQQQVVSSGSPVWSPFGGELLLAWV